MVRRRLALAVIALVGSVIAIGAGGGTRPAYDAVTTAACLLARPDAVGALPPASVGTRPALYVYLRPPHAESYPPGARQLWVWLGSGAAARLQGEQLIFFRDARSALAYRNNDAYGPGRLDRNVYVGLAASHGKTPPRLSRIVQRCLSARRPGSGRPPTPSRPLPSASLLNFTGYWGGHVRSLWVKPGGLALEHVNDGCCLDVITVSLRLLRVTGTVKNATATFRVTAVERGDWSSRRRPRVGQIGKLVLDNGIVTESLTGISYCSDPAWGATGACGA